MGLPKLSVNWREIAQRFGTAVDDLYWRAIFHYSIQDSYVEAARRLSNADRHRDALDLAGAHAKHLEPAEAAAFLIELLPAFQQGGIKPEHMVKHYAKQLLERAYKAPDVDKTELARMEISLIPFLGCRPQLRVTRALLHESPDLFAELIGYAYSEREDQDGAAERSRLAARLIQEFVSLPPQVLFEAPPSFTAWFESVRRTSIETGCGDQADRVLGELLFHSPQGSDGVRPAEFIRDLFESLRSAPLEDGFCEAASTSFGVQWRNNGPSPESIRAKEYRVSSGQLRIRSPRTARMLDRLANDLDHTGRWLDREITRRDAR